VNAPRRLWVRFRPVEAESMPDYRRAVAAAGEVAAGLGAHFWAFAIDGGGGCVEFLEGPDDGALHSVDQATDAPIREAAGGTATTEIRAGAEAHPQPARSVHGAASASGHSNSRALNRLPVTFTDSSEASHTKMSVISYGVGTPSGSSSG